MLQILCKKSCLNIHHVWKMFQQAISWESVFVYLKHFTLPLILIFTNTSGLVVRTLGLWKRRQKALNVWYRHCNLFCLHAAIKWNFQHEKVLYFIENIYGFVYREVGYHFDSHHADIFYYNLLFRFITLFYMILKLEVLFDRSVCVT